MRLWAGPGLGSTEIDMLRNKVHAPAIKKRSSGVMFSFE